MMTPNNQKVYKDMLVRAKNMGFEKDIQRLETIDIAHSTQHRDEEKLNQLKILSN